ncbi:O-antigen ligase [Acinetobacter sp. YH12134]|uniref:O-antigen ligase family protein n=1 Tax=Acinetobacter sp. YH12134 TaxID=2601118 RepID=UPI0015D2F1FE|nr:O-antigen ligase family protein [Acinetobacter sp. YH12134]
MKGIIAPNIGLINLSTTLMLMLFLSFLKVVNSNFLKLMGDFFLLTSLIVILFISIFNFRVFLKINKNILFSLLPLLCIGLVYFINTFFSINPIISLQRSFLIFLIFFAMSYFYKVGLIDYGSTLRNKLYYLLSIILILIVIYYFINPGFSNYQSFFLNPNAFGMYTALLFLSLIYLGGKKFKFLIFLIGLFFVYISSSRTSLLAYISSCAFIYFGYYFYASKKLYISIIFLLIVFAIAVIYFMAYLDLTSYNELVRGYTGKNLLSGRNEVWPYVLNLTQQHPYLGWGGGVNLSDIGFYTFSSHNFYLHTALQIGYFGVFLVFVFYVKFWNFILKGKYNRNIYYANGLFIYLILIQNFEVTLLQNNLAMSVPVLCLISYIIGNSLSEKKEINKL